MKLKRGMQLLSMTGHTLMAIGLMLLVQPVQAADLFDGSANLVCAPTRVMSCTGDFRCKSGRPAEVNVPQFVTFRFDGAEIEMTYSPQETKRLPIREIHNTSNTMVMMGVLPEGGAYTFEIHRHNGNFFASGIEPSRFSFFIAGACKSH